MPFVLDPILARDSALIIDLELSQLRLINNKYFPWVILVPRLPNISEISDLSIKQYQSLSLEVLQVANVLNNVFKPDKLNVATIGNKVKQLHYHIIVRYVDDACFPETVWGHVQDNYKPSDMQDKISKIKAGLM